MGPAPSQVLSVPLHDAALPPSQQRMIPRDPCQEHTHTWPCGPVLCVTPAPVFQMCTGSSCLGPSPATCPRRSGGRLVSGGGGGGEEEAGGLQA